MTTFRTTLLAAAATALLATLTTSAFAGMILERAPGGSAGNGIGVNGTTTQLGSGLSVQTVDRAGGLILERVHGGAH